MSTRAEEFRYQQERSGPKRAPRVKRERSVLDPGARPEAGHAAGKAPYALEDAVGGPSRMSTRGASNRQRTDGQSQAKRRNAEVRPRPPPP
jgi:hypothetical protein